MHYDVIIAGGGIVGSLLACLLGQSGRRVALIEAQRPAELSADAPFELRVSAISRASQQVLQQAGAWAGIKARRVTPYHSMVVWDATGAGEIRFDAADMGEPELGHIIENKVLQLALLAVIADNAHIDLLCPATLQQFSKTAEGVEVTLDNGRELTGLLLVGADGAQSVVREQANIAWQREDYGQKGVVCVAKTALAHQSTAWQRFMPDGPLAFLPLRDRHYCSIVWSLPADVADVMLGLDELVFNQKLGAALDSRLGAIESSSQRAAFPLQGARAAHYAQERLALVGDAAHTIHPLAGQGVNLGISDVAALAEQLNAMPAADPGDGAALRRYERARKGDNMLTLRAMEGFSMLFGNQQPLLKLTRNSGLSLLNRLTPLKNSLARRAMGI